MQLVDPVVLLMDLPVGPTLQVQAPPPPPPRRAGAKAPRASFEAKRWARGPHPAEGPEEARGPKPAWAPGPHPGDGHGHGHH